MNHPLNEENLISLSDFKEFLFHTIVPIEDIEDKDGKPISEILIYWRKKNLVPFIPSGKHTVNFRFSDIIWFRILDVLRGFSYPVEKMKSVTDYFFKDAYFDELAKKNFLYNKEQLNKKKLAGTISQQEQNTLDFIEDSLKDESFQYLLRFHINYLTNLISDCISSEEDRAILIFMDGRVAELHGDIYYTHSGFEVNTTEPHLFISLRFIFSEFVKKAELAKLFIPYLLNEKEKNVLRQIKDRNLKEIIIKTKDGEISKIEVKKGQTISGPKAKEIKTMLGLKNYENITIKTIDGKSLYLETKSSKFK
jgi:hypothetical protein